MSTRLPVPAGEVEGQLLVALPLLRPIASASTASLISWLRAGEAVPEAMVPAAIDALVQLAADYRMLDVPSQPHEVTGMLEMVAATVQVEVPEPAGLAAYVALLGELPPHVLQAAAIKVLRTHVYRTMPLPAEFLATHAVKEWTYIRGWLPKFCGQQAERLQLRLDHTA